MPNRPHRRNVQIVDHPAPIYHLPNTNTRHQPPNPRATNNRPQRRKVQSVDLPAPIYIIPNDNIERLIQNQPVVSSHPQPRNVQTGTKVITLPSSTRDRVAKNPAPHHVQNGSGVPRPDYRHHAPPAIAVHSYTRPEAIAQYVQKPADIGYRTLVPPVNTA